MLPLTVLNRSSGARPVNPLPHLFTHFRPFTESSTSNGFPELAPGFRSRMRRPPLDASEALSPIPCRPFDDIRLLTTDNCSKLLALSELRVGDVNG
jgi:hypothetical protein